MSRRIKGFTKDQIALVLAAAKKDRRSLRVRVLDVRPEDAFPTEQVDTAYAVKISKSLRRRGWKGPAAVAVGRKSAYVIINGHHRLRAALGAGLHTVPVAVLLESQFEYLRQIHNTDRIGFEQVLQAANPGLSLVSRGSAAKRDTW